MCKHMNINVCVHTCTHMIIDVCVHTCTHRNIDVCVRMCTHMMIDVCVHIKISKSHGAHMHIDVILKIALYTLKRALYILKRALYTLKRAVYILKRATHDMAHTCILASHMNIHVMYMNTYKYRSHKWMPHMKIEVTHEACVQMNTHLYTYEHRSLYSFLIVRILKCVISLITHDTHYSSYAFFSMSLTYYSWHSLLIVRILSVSFDLSSTIPISQHPHFEVGHMTHYSWLSRASHYSSYAFVSVSFDLFLMTLSTQGSNDIHYSSYACWSVVTLITHDCSWPSVLMTYYSWYSLLIVCILKCVVWLITTDSRYSSYAFLRCHLTWYSLLIVRILKCVMWLISHNTHYS